MASEDRTPQTQRESKGGANADGLAGAVPAEACRSMPARRAKEVSTGTN